MTDKTVLVFRSDYLPISETFISDHLRMLERYRAAVVCHRETVSAHRVPLRPHTLPANRLGHWLLDKFGWSRKFDAVLKQEQPALVHAHFLTDAASILPFMERNALPFVMTAHGYDATLNDDALRQFAEGRRLLQRRDRLIARADAVICVSDFIKGELVRKGFPETKLTVLHLGVELDALPARNLSGATARGIVCVGRLVEKKGTRYLIEAYARLPEALRDAHPLTIVGDGPLRNDLEQLAGQLGVKVDFLGAQPRSVVMQQLSSAAVFALPSIRAANGDAEGMPIAIMEALAMNVPVCIFDDQPMAPLLAQHSAGLLPRAGDADSLASELGRVLADPELASRHADAGLALVKACFDLRANVQALESFYDAVCRDKAGGRA